MGCGRQRFLLREPQQSKGVFSQLVIYISLDSSQLPIINSRFLRFRRPTLITWQCSISSRDVCRTNLSATASRSAWCRRELASWTWFSSLKRVANRRLWFTCKVPYLLHCQLLHSLVIFPSWQRCSKVFWLYNYWWGEGPSEVFRKLVFFENV